MGVYIERDWEIMPTSDTVEEMERIRLVHQQRAAIMIYDALTNDISVEYDKKMLGINVETKKRPFIKKKHDK